MRERGVEPLHPCEYWHLKPARLPIPPLAHRPVGQGREATTSEIRLIPMLNKLKAVVGEADVLTSAEQIAGYATDWTGRFSSSPIAVVRPHTAEQVVDILRKIGRAHV